MRCCENSQVDNLFYTSFKCELVNRGLYKYNPLGALYHDVLCYTVTVLANMENDHLPSYPWFP